MSTSDGGHEPTLPDHPETSSYPAPADNRPDAPGEQHPVTYQAAPPARPFWSRIWVQIVSAVAVALVLFGGGFASGWAASPSHPGMHQLAAARAWAGQHRGQTLRQDQKRLQELRHELQREKHHSGSSRTTPAPKKTPAPSQSPSS